MCSIISEGGRQGTLPPGVQEYAVRLGSALDERAQHVLVYEALQGQALCAEVAALNVAEPVPVALIGEATRRGT
jgi:hypothetical protein